MNRRHFHQAVSALFGAAVGPSAWAQVPGWVFATAYGDAVHHTVNIRNFVADWQAGGAAGVAVDLKTNASLKKMPEILPALEKNEIQMGEVLMSAYADWVPTLNIDSIPFIVRKTADARQMWASSRAIITKALAQRGIEVLFVVPWPGQGLFTRRPIQRLDSLKQQKFRVYNEATKRMAELAGAEPVNIAAAALADAVAGGQVDAMITSSATGVDSRVWSSMKMFYDLNAWIPKNMVCVNARAMAALPESSRTALRAAAERAQERGWQLAEAADRQAKDLLRSNGVTIEAAPYEVRRVLSVLGEKMSREWANKSGVANVLVLLEYFDKRG